MAKAPTMRPNTITPPIAPPAMAPVLFEEEGFSDGNGDGDGVDEAVSESAVAVEGPGEVDVDGDGDVDALCDSFGASRLPALGFAVTGLPSSMNSPLPSLQHASAAVPFPQQ